MRPLLAHPHWVIRDAPKQYLNRSTFTLERKKKFAREKKKV